MVKTKGWFALTIFLGVAWTGSSAPALKIVPEGSGFRVGWNSETGRVYHLVASPEIGSPPYTLTTITAAVPNISTFVLPSGPRTFYQVQKDADVDGTLVLTNGQLLSGLVDFEYRTIATGTNQVAFVEIVEIFSDETSKRMTAITGVGLTSGTLRLNTAEFPSGEHKLQLRIQELGRDPDKYGPHEVTEPVTVTFFNPVYYTEPPGEAGWKLHYEFATYVPRGTWEFLIKSPDGSTFRTASGTIEDDTNQLGVIEVEDAYINDGGLRPRNPGDQYPDHYYDVFLIITPQIQAAPVPLGLKAAAAEIPDPTTYTNRMTNYVRTVVKHRADYRLFIVAEQPGIVPTDGTRTLFNVMMDTYWAGLGQYGPQWVLNTMTYDINPLPSSDAWNRLHTANWPKLNTMLAGVGPEQPTGVFTFSHGSVNGIGSSTAGGGGGVTAATLAALGYTGGSATNATNALTFGLSYFFPDACMAAAGGFIPLLLIHGSTGEISRSKMLKRGLFPHFGCGWKKIKTVGIATGVDIIDYHGTFVGWFGAKTVEFDPVNNWAANTYRQADSYAADQLPFYLFKVHWDFTMFGIPDGYIDE